MCDGRAPLLKQNEGEDDWTGKDQPDSATVNFDNKQN